MMYNNTATGMMVRVEGPECYVIGNSPDTVTDAELVSMIKEVIPTGWVTHDSLVRAAIEREDALI